MIDLSIFKDDELEYIVNVIPRTHAISYLKKNSKGFNNIKPGFRAVGLPDNQLYQLLYKELQKNNGFIVTFVLAFLENSLKEIADAYQAECKSRDEATALIYTLNNCYFRDRISIYFKLINKEVSQAEINNIVAAMDILRESINQQNLMRNDLESKEKQINALTKDIEELNSSKTRRKKEMDSIVSKNNELQVEITASLTQNNELSEKIAKCLEENQELNKTLDEINKKLKSKETELQKLREEKEELAIQLSSQYQYNQDHLQKIKELEEALDESRTLSVKIETNDNIWEVSSSAGKYYCPEDKEEFQELVSYYLEDSEITDGRALLVSYITRITFAGKPIVGNRQDCRFLVSCLSNVLTNGESIALNFSDSIALNDISNALNSDCRIIYLDNFIGNFNETVLYSLLEKYRNKIIVISAMFDRTFNYVDSEFLSFCHYFNVSRLKHIIDFNFDAVILEEKEYVPTAEILQNAPTLALRSILKELNFSKGTIQNLIINIESHEETIGILAFCVIPYLIDVDGINPYDRSERLNEYCNKNRNINLLNQWFEHE